MKLAEIFGARLKRQEPLSRHTNYRVGGPADFYLEAKTVVEVATAVKAAQEDHLPIFVLGGGSNILVSDAGVRGLVLVLNMRKVTVEGTKVIAEAGAVTAAVANVSAGAGLTGFEWAVGVPGTIGGAVRGNAGCFGGEMKDAVESVDAIDMRTGQDSKFNIQDSRFAYRESRFKTEPFVVTSVTLSLSKGDAPTALAAIKDFMSRRKEKQPLEYSSAGCIFKNFEFADSTSLDARLRAILPQEFVDARRIPAGWLIDRVDIKGTRIGDALISEKHGNFFVNAGNASAEQIIELISLAKMKVRDAFGVQLQDEIQLVGF